MLMGWVLFFASLVTLFGTAYWLLCRGPWWSCQCFVTHLAALAFAIAFAGFRDPVAAIFVPVPVLMFDAVVTTVHLPYTYKVANYVFIAARFAQVAVLSMSLWALGDRGAAQGLLVAALFSLGITGLLIITLTLRSTTRASDTSLSARPVDVVESHESPPRDPISLLELLPPKGDFPVGGSSGYDK